jgi:hypothetical protein
VAWHCGGPAAVLRVKRDFDQIGKDGPPGRSAWHSDFAVFAGPSMPPGERTGVRLIAGA